LSIIRRSCLLTGIKLKLYDFNNNEKSYYNFKIYNLIRLSSENIVDIIPKTKGIKTDLVEFDNIFKDNYELIAFSPNFNQKMFGVQRMLALIEEVRQVYGTYSLKYAD